MSLVKRKIDVTFTLGEGQFGSAKGSPVTISGLRVSATIVSYNSDLQAQLQLRIYGLDQDVMNRLTVIGPIMGERRGGNTVLVAAGDDSGVFTTAFQGIITAAWADYSTAPEVVFNVFAMTGGIDAVRPVAALSYRGAVRAAVICSDLAKAMGLAFEDGGVDVVLSNPYFPGTSLDQLRSCARAARFGYTVESGKLVIWPQAGTRQDDAIQIAPERNLVGYPTFTGDGLALTLLYEPNLGLGKKVQLISVVEAAHGEWVVVSILNVLESEIPGGAWSSQILCRRYVDG